ncbi:MAG: response regulator, partial [Epsilonproteobacteria bacterium]|nr:response regulator [Campylobacterota bacterium]
MKKILIIEDNRAQLKILEMFFKQKGFKVICCENAEEGYEFLLKDNEISLVTLDINLPGMNGLHLLSKIRQDSKFDNIPIVMISALCQDSNIEKALELGANDYFVKPVSLEKLESIVKK